MPRIHITILLLTLTQLMGFTQSISVESKVSKQILEDNKTFNLSSDSFQIGDVYTPNPPVLFQLAKKEIHEFSYPLMDSILRFLQIHNNLLVEIGVHTDQRQSEYCCTNLSQSRAESIVDFLVSKGISSERLIAKGYGDSKPLIPAEEIEKLQIKEEKNSAHQQNRRIEVTIVRLDYVERSKQNISCDSITLAKREQLNQLGFDKPAEFPGGETKFREYLARNLKIQHDNGANHSAYYVHFIVDSTGEIKNQCIVRPTNPYPSGESILKVFETMPQWKPATKNGIPVASSIFFPVRICVGRGIDQIKLQE